MKKFAYIVLVMIIVVLSTALIVVLLNNREKKPQYPEWSQPEVERFYATADYGDLMSITSIDGVTDINSNSSKKYTFDNVSLEDIKLKVGDIILEGDFIHGTTENEKLGNVESIDLSGSNVVVVISDFSNQIVRIKIPQLIVNDVNIEMKVDVFYNNIKFAGEVIEKGYVFDQDNLLDIAVKIASNEVMLLNSRVTVKIAIIKKSNVLIIPKEALINISGEDYSIAKKKYFVDVLRNEKLTRIIVEVQYDNGDYVEVTSGLNSGDKVVLNGK